MMRWNDDNATHRWNAFYVDGLDGGNICFQTLHQHVAVATCTIQPSYLLFAAYQVH